MAKVRMNIVLDETVKEYLVKKAEQLGVSQNAVVNISLSQMKQQEEAMKAMSNIQQVMDRLNELTAGKQL